MINSRSGTSYSASRKLHPLSLSAQLISRQVSGCLTLSAQAAEWRLLFNQGKLNFATSSVDVFARLERQLQALENPVPEQVRSQVRQLFEESNEIDEVVSRDYRAICWLVDQQHLSPEQAAQLIGSIAIEVIEPFLDIREGSYQLIPAARVEGIPTFCNLDLWPLVELCQRNARQRATGQPVVRQLTSTAMMGDRTFQAQTSGMNSLSGNNSGRQGRVNNANTTRRTTYTVACIDDSPTVLNAIQKFLGDQSLSVVAINDPVKALMQIVRSKPDLILLDITMPNLDGYELCSLLRRHPHYRRTPIVMVTGNTGLIDRARAKLVRASDYLTKPFTQSDLLKMVFKHLPAQQP